MWVVAVIAYLLAAAVVQTAFNWISGLFEIVVMAPGLIAQGLSEKRPWLSRIFSGLNLSASGLVGLVASALNVAVIVIGTAYVATRWFPQYERTLWVLAALWGGSVQGWFGFIVIGLIALEAFRL